MKSTNKLQEQILMEIRALKASDQERILKCILFFKQELLIARSSDETIDEIYSARSSNQAFNVNKLKEIIDLASQIYSSEGLRDFLSKPQPVFEGRTAYQLMTTGEYEAIISTLIIDLDGSGS